jgi:hypothetical protein
MQRMLRAAANAKYLEILFREFGGTTVQGGQGVVLQSRTGTKTVMGTSREKEFCTPERLV